MRSTDGLLIDFLTGLPLLRSLKTRLEEEVQRTLKDKSPLSLLIIDLDHFKSINDGFGHSRGDEVLTEFALRLQSLIRCDDQAFRYGGDEFVLLLPDTDQSQAESTAWRLIKTIHSIPFEGSPPLSLSISIGLANLPQDADNADDLFEIADKRLFQAKRTGRGKAVFEDSQSTNISSADNISRLIERDLALEILKQFVELFSHGHRNILQVNAAKGCGSSRFLIEVGNAARLRNYAVFALRGSPALKMRVYGALNEAMLGWEGLSRPYQGAEHFALALQTWITKNGKSGLLIVLDDLHLIDHDTRLFIHDLFFSNHIPVLALAYTNVDTSTPGSLNEVHDQVVVDLSPLTLEGVQIWIRHSLQWEAPQDFLNWFYEQTGGYPKRIQGALMALTEAGILASTNEGWKYPADLNEASITQKLVAQPQIPTNLPSDLSDFIGRESEIEYLKQMMLERRFITIYGPGGVGKTRLALQVAAEIQEEFHDGVFIIPVAGFSDSDDYLLAAFLETLRCSLTGNFSLQQQLVDFLRSKNLLIVLDGFLSVKQMSDLVSIYEQCPGIRLLATSLSRLGVKEEYAYELKELAYPQDGTLDKLEFFPSYQLFVHNTRRNMPQMELSEQDRYAIASICRLVRGMPLDLELAASWVGTFSFEEIAEEIENNLTMIVKQNESELMFPDRYHEAVFDSLWHLLSEPERVILVCFSVFNRSFSLQAAREVTGASRFFILSLAAQSYLKRSDKGRFEIHRLLRQYLIERLKKIPAYENLARKSHARYFAFFVKQREGLLRIGEQTLDELREEWENIRQAWNWMVETGNIEMIDVILEGWQDYNLYMGYSEEGEKLIQKAIKRFQNTLSNGDSQTQMVAGRLHCKRAAFLVNLLQFKEAAEEAELAIKIAKNCKSTRSQIEASIVLGRALLGQGKYQPARKYLTQILKSGWKTGDIPLVLETMAVLARLTFMEGQPAKSLVLLSTIMNHPGLDELTFRKVIQPLWSEMKMKLPKNTFNAGLEAGKTMTPEGIIQDILDFTD